MKNKLLFTAIIIMAFTASYGQNMVINGDFENNTATRDMINCTSPQFDSLMSNVKSFGTWTNPDIIESDDYCNWPEHGKWFIALTGGGSDDVAMQLSHSIIAGNKYVLSFWDAGCVNDGSLFAFEIGVSTNDSTLGTIIYKAPKCVTGVWTNCVDTFTASVSGEYLTVQGQTGYISAWGQLDNVTLTPLNSNPTTTISLNTPSSACANQSTTIAYAGNADSTDNYIWDFDGGNVLSGSGAGPYQISWATAGTYYISLSVTDSTGDTSTTTDSIVINAMPTSLFNILDTTIAAGQTDLVNYTGAGSATYSWNFNNAFIETSNGDTSYALTWAIPGTDTVSLTVSQNGCSSSTTQQLVKVVNPLTVATPICTDSISMISYLGFLNDTGGYNWSFSGANIIAGSGAGPYTLQYTAPGSYAVSLNLTIDSVNYTYTDTIVVSSSGHCFTGVVDSSSFIYNYHDTTLSSTTAGINSLSKKLTINNIYPNPTIGNLTITLNTISAGSIHVDVYDVLGRKIISNIQNVSEGGTTIILTTAELPAGSYFIRLSDDNSNFSNTQKFIKLL